MRMSGRGFLQCLLLVIAAVCLSIVLAELVFRIFVHYDWVEYPKPKTDSIIHQYSKNGKLIYEMKPSSRTGIYQTNQFGMRDREYSIAKPPNTFRIAIVGDSVSLGWKLKKHYVMDEILEDKLNEGKKMNYEVLNFSVVGYNSYQEQIVLEEKVLPFEPDMVIIAFCQNDDTYTDGFHTLAREMSPHSLGSRLHSQFLSYLLHRRERKTYLRWSDMGKVEDLIKRVSVLSKTKNFDPLMLVLPYYFRDVNSYPQKQKHHQVGRLAAEEGLSTIDLLESWKNLSWKERKELYRRGSTLHLSASGMRNVANALYEYIKAHQRA